MSTVYNTEPPTKGKVTLKTTIGDLDIELWPKEAPKAVRNFVQLCLEGYYDGCIFHRVIKDFMAQAGDPSGTGEGGESIYGGPFKDEFHSRLRFAHRGLVACANANAPHTNGSQFFITLDKTEWLDRKNTIFGKIVGDTVYNMLRLNELEVDEATDRPADPPVITSVEVLWNPFEDIVPRTTPAERKAQAQFKKAEEVRKVRKSQKRNLALLSFGEQAEEDEADLARAAAATGGAKIRSAHESKLQGAAAGGKRGRGDSSGSDSDSSDDDGERGGKRSKTAANRSGAAALVAERPQPQQEREQRPRRRGGAGGGGGGDEQQQKPGSKEDELYQLKDKSGAGRLRVDGSVPDGELLKAFELSRAKYKTRKQQVGGRQKDTLSRLAAFTSKLRASQQEQQHQQRQRQQQQHEQDAAAAAADAGADAAKQQGAAAAAAAADGEQEAYDGKVRRDIDHRTYMPAAWRADDYLAGGSDDDDDLDSLRKHKLEFSRAPGDAMARRDELDDYVVFDPLLEEKKGKFSRAAQKEKKDDRLGGPRARLSGGRRAAARGAGRPQRWRTERGAAASATRPPRPRRP
ncbi:CYP57 [Scenedesmus sp. PABB004]|nr:CYP57 [Scenedesmus sp. PABB004]